MSSGWAAWPEDERMNLAFVGSWEDCGSAPVDEGGSVDGSDL